MNVLYLLAGLAAVTTAILHGRWGEKTIIRELKQASITDLAKAGFTVAWHQITAMLTVSGIAIIVLSFIPSMVAFATAGILIVVLYLGNILVFLMVCKRKFPDVIRSTYYPVFNSVAMIVLIILGIIVKNV
ncbi:hypothetical protein AB3N04_07300 [Alkalihalophilus sp. As8PL]|uniref:Uncharacterized protein n=1 Tax=Alkalihalophilus sp. As8PL TaxID=3237103 RepID=A0AB39BXP9_9BACI